MRTLAIVAAACCLPWTLAAAPADGGVPPATADRAAWARVRTAGPGPAQSIGRYGGGCVDGAARLPLHGPGYSVVHPARERLFGHPNLISLLVRLGAEAHTAKLPALHIGDLGQIRGGPAPTGHASHQSGLDVDIAYIAPATDGSSRAIVDLARLRLLPTYTPTVARMLALVVAASVVDRVFVNPVIKRALCEANPTDRGWLHKLRPWWGHHDHFHVRLSCPADSPLCETQAPLPVGDGCEELDWWFTKSADHDNEKKGYQARVGGAPALPEPCQKLIAPSPPPPD